LVSGKHIGLAGHQRLYWMWQFKQIGDKIQTRVLVLNPGMIEYLSNRS
jgi:hypothetical protein